MTERRRQPNGQEHALAVRNNAGQLEVTCACGQHIATRRDGDTQTISLSDLLGLVRVHHGNA